MCRHSDYIRTAIKDGAFTETAPLTLMATSSTATTLLLKMIYDVCVLDAAELASHAAQAWCKEYQHARGVLGDAPGGAGAALR